MTTIVNMLLGVSWKSSLIGLLVGVALAVVTYAQGRSEPGWYIVAAGFAALARMAKDWDKTGAPTPPAP